MGDAYSGATEEHESAAAVTVYENHGDEAGDEVDGAGDDDVEEDLADGVAGGAIDFVGVVEEDVDARPLLKNGEQAGDDGPLAGAWKEEFGPGGLLLMGIAAGVGGEYGREFSLGICRAANTIESGLGLLDSAFH